MTNILEPVPTGKIRKQLAKQVRDEATDLANKRLPAVHQKNNGEANEALQGNNHEPVAAHGTYTKGLAHDEYGRVQRGDLRKFISEINQDGNGTTYDETPFPGTYKGPDAGKAAVFDAPLYGGDFLRASSPEDIKVRSWESPIAGHTFDLQGGDADQTMMPPAPAIATGDKGAELTAEMAEVYTAALLRDVPFSQWETDGKVDDAVATLEQLPFFSGTANLNAAGTKRREARFGPHETQLSKHNLLRGSTPGAQTGPYISQFMLLGSGEPDSADPTFGAASTTKSSTDGLTRSGRHVPPVMRGIEMASTEDAVRSAGEEEGFIRFGTQTIAQQFVPHQENVDHMSEWGMWLDVQNGANRKGRFDLYLTEDRQPDGKTQGRFITTPRDLATYVHFDALYQAYLNACLLLLGKQWPTDAGLPEGPGHPTRDNFATFGGPHILTLVTEVATRALKAVRRQKYNVHLRSRPEALAAAVSLAWVNDDADKSQLGGQKDALGEMATALDDSGLLTKIADRNKVVNDFWASADWDIDYGPGMDEDTNALLPMAFPEGSPMHPAYGAGHATVAGACVTVLKAFFEMYDIGDKRGTFSIYDIIEQESGYSGKLPTDLFGEARSLIGAEKDQFEAAYQALFTNEPKTLGTKLDPVNLGHTVLTTQGELDKLAANISIGRNFGGVHFYTDYYESLRMGERIAVSMLQEHMLTYREPVSMRFTSFDDDRIMLIGTGGSEDLNDSPVLVWDEDGNGGRKSDFENWLTRYQG